MFLYCLLINHLCVCVFWHNSRTWQTHTRTDTAWRHRPRLCIASRGKNDKERTILHVIKNKFGTTLRYCAPGGSDLLPQQPRMVFGCAWGFAPMLRQKLSPRRVLPSPVLERQVALKSASVVLCIDVRLCVWTCVCVCVCVCVQVRVEQDAAATPTLLVLDRA